MLSGLNVIIHLTVLGKGTDHAASLEPDGVRKLVRDCRAVAKALTYKKEDILDIEKEQRNKLKSNQVKWQ